MGSSPASQRLSRLAPLSDVCARIDAMARPAEPRVADLADAAGRTLAADVVIAAAVPPRAAALRDGWAVRSETVANASPYEPVSLTPPPAWVEIGDELPDASDAVLPADAVSEAHGAAEAHAPVSPGDGVLPAGGDAEPRHVLRRAGERLRHADIAALRGAGLLRAAIRAPRLRVVLVSSAIDETSDSIGPFLLRVIDADGGSAELIRTGGDRAALGRALAGDGADAVVTVGGTGAGRRDAAVRTLASIGRVDFHGMAVRPGETAALGAAGARLVLMLPGRLDAALAIWLLLGRRLMACLCGRKLDRISTPMTLTRKIVSTIGMTDLVLLGTSDGGVEPLASGCFPLRSMARAAGWVVLPPESEGVAAGSTIEMQPLP